ncbi:putative membrane protein [Synechococcus sp. PCC 7502]|nr:putative membrane protein [Synechococcus sp. PCC 7502]
MALHFRGSVAPIVLPRVLMFTGFAYGVAWLYKLHYIPTSEVLESLTGNVVYNLVLGLLLVFRTNAAYDKFWEGRKLWGTLVVNIRNLAREIQLGIIETDEKSKAAKIRAIRLLSAFAIATKLHLRQEPIDQSLQSLVSPSEVLKLEQVSNPPLEITFWISAYLHQQYRCHQLDSTHLHLATDTLNSLIEGLTGCERISKTPIPLAYSIYLKRLILIYCLSLPFHFVASLGLWTAAFVGLVSFILLGVEEIANEIEMPFGTDPNDLPLEQICQNIIDNGEAVIAFTPDTLNFNPEHSL